ESHQLRCQRRVALVAPLRKSSFQLEIAALDIPVLLQLAGEPLHRGQRLRREQADARILARLRARHQRPRRGSATEQRNELAPVDHSITSSARASSVGLTSSPRALAVLRLITSSNFVGWMTGKSAGLAPLRIWPA